VTRGESELISDLNDFVRQTSDQLDEQDTSTGIRPNPVIEVTEQTLDTSRFGLEFAPQPLAEAQPDSQGGEGEPTGACCVETDCTIETEPDCTGMGGTYQGDGTNCDPNPCVSECPCQPTHISTSWSLNVDCGCTVFSDSWTDEQDIPVLDPGNNCEWDGTFNRTIFGIGVDGDCQYDIASEILLSYNYVSEMWELLLDIFIGDHAIFCAHCGGSIPVDGVILSKDGIGNGLVTFECPPNSDGFDLVWDAVPCITGHVEFSIS
jgi:hypothetical protein